VPEQTSPSHFSSGASSSSHTSESILSTSAISRDGPPALSNPSTSPLAADPASGGSPQSSDPPGSQLSEVDEKMGRNFLCDVPGCGRRFRTAHNLEIHTESHFLPRRTFTCTCTQEGCSEQFTRQHDRLRHEVSKHGQHPEWRCTDCGRFFSTKRTLAHHKCPMSVVSHLMGH
jgi:Zinc finger, C2H2 type